MRIPLSSTLLLTAQLSFGTMAFGEDVVTKHGDGSIAERYTLIDNERQGGYTSFHSNGQLRFKGTYRDNALFGPVVSYHENGQVYRSGSISHQHGLTGLWQEFDADGVLRAHGHAEASHYGVNDYNSPVKTGVWKWHHGNGQLSFTASYVSNNIDGAFSSYHNNGQLFRTGSITLNKGLTGEWKEYDAEGVLRAVGAAEGSHYGMNDYNSPIKTGEWNWFHGNGQKSFTAKYTSNNIDGAFSSFHNNGQVFRTGTVALNQGLSGEWKEFDAAGVLRAVGNAEGSHYGVNDYNSPVKTGEWNWFHGNGQKSFTAKYTSNNIDGVFSSFHNNGQVFRTGTIAVNQGLTGEWKEFDAAGILRAVGNAEGSHYGVNDYNSPVKTGEWKWFHGNGQKSFTATYAQNNITGAFSSFHENGQVFRTGTIAHNEGLNGEWKEYDSAGTLRVIGQAAGSHYGVNDYNSPVKDGEWKWFHGNGELKFIASYRGNNITGAFTSYHDNGKQHISGTIRHNHGCSGLWTSFHASGNKRSEGHAVGSRYGVNDYNSPIGHGPWVWYHDNGVVSQRGSYARGKRVGIWYRYDENGKLLEAKHAEIDGETTVASSQDEHGNTITVVGNPDGSRTKTITDKDGNIISVERIPAPGKGPSTASSTDPDTNITTTVTKDENGEKHVSTSWTDTNEQGEEVVHEVRDDGTETHTATHADGRQSVHTIRPDGSESHINRESDGSVRRIDVEQDGSQTESVYKPNGSEEIVRRDADGHELERTTRDPSGHEKTVRDDGTIIERELLDNGIVRETRTTPDGRKIVSEIQNGEVVSRTEDGQDIERNDPLAEEEHARETKERKQAATQREADQQRKEATDGTLTQADDTVANKPAKVKPVDAKTIDPYKAAEKDLANAEKELKWLGAFIEKLPKSQIEQFQAEIEKVLADDPENRKLIAELMSQDRAGLAGWINRHPEVMKSFEEKVLPTLKKGTSVVGSYISFQKGMFNLEKGEYGKATMDFIDAGTNTLGILPESTLKKIEQRLGFKTGPAAGF